MCAFEGEICQLELSMIIPGDLKVLELKSLLWILELKCRPIFIWIIWTWFPSSSQCTKQRNSSKLIKLVCDRMIQNELFFFYKKLAENLHKSKDVRRVKNSKMNSTLYRIPHIRLFFWYF